MGIEQKKRALTHDKHFIRLQENERSFSTDTFGGIMRIYDPFNPDNVIEIKRIPEEIQKYRDKNVELIRDFQERIDVLMQEKARLQKKIF
jgi:hypothetical protein